MSANDFVNLRNKLGIKQEELSDAFGLYSKNTISRWETGLREPQEVVRRLVCLLNDLPKKEALDFVTKLGQYKKLKKK
jgi:transcriptional regulator with XRE-family HTH domain